jgi:hypothetical protein
MNLALPAHIWPGSGASSPAELQSACVGTIKIEPVQSEAGISKPRREQSLSQRLLLAYREPRAWVSHWLGVFF